MARKIYDAYYHIGRAVTGPNESVCPDCVGCYYWRATSGLVVAGEHCCHYYLDHGIGHRRDGDDKKCKSRKPKGKGGSEA